MRAHLLAAAALFVVAFAIRWHFLQGLVLGDDPQEFAVLLHVLTEGPLWTDQLHLRFAGWIFNHLAFWLFGVSETAFLAPTAILSSTLPILAYAVLLRWGYGRTRAFLGALFVATAPFEVMLGSLRANDSYLELALAGAFAAVVLLEERPVGQGIVVALCLWFAFYVKLFAVFALPALGLYYLAGRRWRAAAAFTVASAVVHGATCVVWKAKLGTFFPFVSTYAANYPVALPDLPELFLKYVRLIFVGSFEFPSTLWGAVPWIALVLVVVKAIGALAGGRFPESLRLDRADRMLLVAYGTFFLLMEFFPNGFRLDAYYSVPRIFRYLAPLSFPIALHAAKLVLDVARLPVVGVAPATVAAALVLPLVVVNVAQAADATGPGRVYRRALLAVLADVRAEKPPMLVAEAILASYLRDLYLDPDTDPTEVVVLHQEHAASEYERWLRAHEGAMPSGTLLVTGLASFVHYGAHIDGYRLQWFEKPLSPEWKLAHEYGLLTYLPRPEPARLWRLERAAGATPPVVHDVRENLASLAGMDDPAALFAAGMARYDANDYPGARLYFAKILRTRRPDGDNAAFFYAASFFRESAWQRTRHEFKRLIRRYPQSRWVPAAYWHIGVCEARLGHLGRARRTFATVVRRFPNDPATATLARQDLERLQRRRGGVVARWWRST